MAQPQATRLVPHGSVDIATAQRCCAAAKGYSLPSQQRRQCTKRNGPYSHIRERNPYLRGDLHTRMRVNP